MFIFEMALVTKHDVQFAFLFVYTVFHVTLESCSYKTLYAEVLSWFIIWRRVKLNLKHHLMGIIMGLGARKLASSFATSIGKPAQLQRIAKLSKIYV